MRYTSEREIYMNGRYVMCQVMNWRDGEPPKYILCNPLGRGMSEPFFACQRWGTWAKADVFALADELNRDR